MRGDTPNLQLQRCNCHATSQMRDTYQLTAPLRAEHNRAQHAANYVEMLYGMGEGAEANETERKVATRIYGHAAKLGTLIDNVAKALKEMGYEEVTAHTAEAAEPTAAQRRYPKSQNR